RRSGGLDPLAEPLVAQGGVLWEGRVVEVSAVELPETPGHERVVVRRFGVPGVTGDVFQPAPGGAVVALQHAVPRRGSDAAGKVGEQAGAVELDLAVRPVERGRRGVRLRQGPSLEDDGPGFGGAVCDRLAPKSPDADGLAAADERVARPRCDPGTVIGEQSLNGLGEIVRR